VSDISALSNLMYVGGAMTVSENYYLTESNIGAGFRNLRVAGAVDIDFFAKPPTVPGAVATKTGSVNQCTAGLSSTTSPANGPTSTESQVTTSSTESPSSTVDFSCAKADPQACAYIASSNCGAFAMNSVSDIDAWLTADDGQPCSVIGGSLTIQQWNIKAADLAKMMPLVAVCGSVTIQQLATGTLQGLNNLSYIGGSFFLAQNARPWASGGDVSDISALSNLMYVGGAMTVSENYYLTESNIGAGFRNLRVAGAVDINFYANPPTVPGAVATKTGSVNQCTASLPSTISTAIVEGIVSITIDNATEVTTYRFKIGATNAIAAIAKVGADQVSITISANTRRLRLPEGRRTATSVRIDYVIQLLPNVSPSVIANNLNSATSSAALTSFTKAFSDVGITEIVSIASITSSISSITQSTTVTPIETFMVSATIRVSHSLVATFMVFIMFVSTSCSST